MAAATAREVAPQPAVTRLAWGLCLLAVLLAVAALSLAAFNGQLSGGDRHQDAGLGGGYGHPGRGRPVPTGPPPGPAGGRPALQPAQVRRGPDH